MTAAPGTTTYATGPGGWLRAEGAWVRFADEDGRLVAAQVVLGAPVDTSRLQRLPLGRIQAWANGQGAERLRADMGATDAPDPAADLEAMRWDTARKRRKRQGFTSPALPVPTTRDKGDDFYRAVASIYKDAAAEGGSPLDAIQTAAGPPVIVRGEGTTAERPPESTVYRWIRECRRRGFLPPGRTGKAG